MAITGKNSLSSALRIILDILLVANLIVLLLLPWLLNAIYADPALLGQLDRQTGEATADFNRGESPAGPTYPSDVPADSYPFYLVFLYGAGFGTAWILAEGHWILRRLEKNVPFAAGQAASFRRVSYAFAGLAILFAIKIAVHNTLLTMFCAGLFLLLVLIAQILAEIFRQANLVKTENELTI
jgi:hypothetical protein